MHLTAFTIFSEFVASCCDRSIRLPPLHERIEGSCRVVPLGVALAIYPSTCRRLPLPFASRITPSTHRFPCRELRMLCANVKRKLTSPRGSCRPHASRTGNKIYFRRRKFYGRPANGRWPEARGTLAVEPPERVVIGPTPPPSSRPPWKWSSHTSDTDSGI